MASKSDLQRINEYFRTNFVDVEEQAKSLGITAQELRKRMSGMIRGGKTLDEAYRTLIGQGQRTGAFTVGSKNLTAADILAPKGARKRLEEKIKEEAREAAKNNNYEYVEPTQEYLNEAVNKKAEEVAYRVNHIRENVAHASTMAMSLLPFEAPVFGLVGLLGKHLGPIAGPFLKRAAAPISKSLDKIAKGNPERVYTQVAQVLRGRTGSTALVPRPKGKTVVGDPVPIVVPNARPTTTPMVRSPTGQYVSPVGSLARTVDDIGKAVKEARRTTPARLHTARPSQARALVTGAGAALYNEIGSRAAEGASPQQKEAIKEAIRSIDGPDYTFDYDMEDYETPQELIAEPSFGRALGLRRSAKEIERDVRITEALDRGDHDAVREIEEAYADLPSPTLTERTKDWTEEQIEAALAPEAKPFESISETLGDLFTGSGEEEILEDNQSLKKGGKVRKKTKKKTSYAKKSKKSYAMNKGGKVAGLRKPSRLS